MLNIASPPDPCSVRMEAVTHRYGRLQSIRGVNLEIQQGEFVYLVGPSASGKTTLLKLIHGEERVRNGRIWVDGTIVGRRSRSLRRRIGVVFQEYRLLERRTAIENVTYALRVADLTLSRRQVQSRAIAALDQCGISDRATAYPAELSGGQRQRLAIARALAARPRLLLADEPTASLDAENARKIVRLLQAIAERGTTVVFATHDLDLVLAGRDRVIELADGELVRNRDFRARWASG